MSRGSLWNLSCPMMQWHPLDPCLRAVIVVTLGRKGIVRRTITLVRIEARITVSAMMMIIMTIAGAQVIRKGEGVVWWYSCRRQAPEKSC